MLREHAVLEDAMKADEATELMDKDREHDRFKQLAAMVIGVLAMILAITGLGGSNAGKEAINNNVLASNYFSFYQAKNLRQSVLTVAVDEFEVAWLSQPALPEATQNAIREKLRQYKATIARYDSEPETNEGKKELMALARAHEAKRDHALKQDPYFDYAEALLQIAIVLISVAIVANLVWLSFVGSALGLLGSLLAINGFLLLVEIPGLA
jgi:CHASE2 domain-containing sensor protein